MDVIESRNVIALSPREAEARWEALCNPSKGCQVVCCYYAGAPCEHLDLPTGRCAIYPTRFGRRRTTDGVEFLCAPMSAYLMKQAAPACCGYRVVRSIEGRPVMTEGRD